jgi:hypothetical protein
MTCRNRLCCRVSAQPTGSPDQEPVFLFWTVSHVSPTGAPARGRIVEAALERFGLEIAKDAEDDLLGGAFPDVW